MGGASRARALVAGLVVFVVVAVPGPVAADEGPVTCPAEVDGQPLALTAPFSGTVRAVADDDGRIVRRSLRCAYGEGIGPVVDLTIAWEEAGGCTTSSAAATGVAPDAVDRALAHLARSLGGLCPLTTTPPSTPSNLPLVLGFATLAAVVSGAAVLVTAPARRRRVPVDASPPPRPDLTPVLAALSTSGGRAFTRSVSGQLASVAALAYGRSWSAIGDRARAGAVQALPAHRPATGEVAALAARLRSGS
jgi:hypothetical protein